MNTNSITGDTYPPCSPPARWPQDCPGTTSRPGSNCVDFSHGLDHCLVGGGGGFWSACGLCNTCRFLQHCEISAEPAPTILTVLQHKAPQYSRSISVVVNSALCALKNLPQLDKESTTSKLCLIDAVTVKSYLLVLVVEDITRGILAGSDLKMVKTTFPWWTSVHHQQ